MQDSDDTPAEPDFPAIRRFNAIQLRLALDALRKVDDSVFPFPTALREAKEILERLVASNPVKP